MPLSCRHSRIDRSAQLPPGDKEVEIIVPCTGPGFFTDSLVFRASALGESIDLSIAKRKAMSNARTQLAADIQTTVRTVNDAYVNSIESSNEEQVSVRFEGFAREVVRQELKGIRVICERYFRTEEGKFKTYVAIELSAAGLVEAYYQRLASSQTANNDFEQLKKLLSNEMHKSGNR